MTDTRPMPSSFPLEKAGAEVSPQLALALYAIAEYSTVIDHCQALRKVGLPVPFGVIERLHRELRHTIHRTCYLLGVPLLASVASDEAMVQRAREWLAEHPDEIDRIERGGEANG